MTSIAELTKENNFLKQFVEDLQERLCFAQHDLTILQKDVERYADEYAGLVAERDEEIEKLKEAKQALTVGDAFQICRDNGYSVLEEPKSAEKGECDWCEYEHILQEYMDFNDETGLYDVATDLCEGCVQDRNKFAKQEYEEAFAEIKKLKAEIEYRNQQDKKREQSVARKARKTKAEKQQQEEMIAEMAALKAEIEELKAENRIPYLVKALNADREGPINFDDANMEFYWAATNGDVIFWKVPCELHDLTEEDGETSRVLSAFQCERFGDEWGSLSSHTVRTMDLLILEENEQ